MSRELAKNYEPAAVEAEAYRVWMEEKCFSADAAAPGEPYCIVIPPPNVTGALHLGHAINTTLQDLLIRHHRMRGFNTLWIPGIDHAGIATQAVVERQLKEQENKTRHDVGRDGLVERIWAWKQQYGDRILAQLKRIGASCDWDRARFTLDERCAKAVRETFFKLFRDGLIYRGKRLVNWDVFLQTSVSDDEIYHETVKTFLWHIRYRIVEGAEARKHEGAEPRSEDRPPFMVVATTRPETLLGDTAVAVHSQDARWNWAIGSFVELPLTGRRIPIIADDVLVDPKFGSGVVKVTPAHDPNDYAVWQRHLGQADQIDILNILNADGTINEAGGPYAGLRRDVARKQVVEDLTSKGLLQKEEPYETQVGHSDRSKTPVEPYLSDQWFVKMAPLAEPALEVVRDGTIKFHPERHAQQYLAWLGEKRDWPISRQLWWGHRIPVWTGDTEHPYFRARFQPKGSAAQPSFFHDSGLEISRQEIVNADGSMTTYLCLPPGHPQVESDLQKGGFVQDPDVLDTWFSSALWPHSTLGWPDDSDELKKWYPTSVLLTGRDIITLWVARMVMTGMYNMGQRAISTEEISANPAKRLDSGRRLGIPFYDVAINPTILDGKGERMSKSKGNGVDPVDIIDNYGADALRFTLTSMATETQDVRMPVKKDAGGRNTSEKFDLGRNFCNKLWNAARFALSNLETAGPEPVDAGRWSIADRWIVSRFNHSLNEANAALQNYRFDQFARSCYDFFWRDFCDWYVEAIKPAMRDPARAGQTANVLAAVLDGALRLLHPMIPFITETIWWRLNEVRPTRGLPGLLDAPSSARLILASWPAVGPVDEAVESTFSALQELIGVIRNLRNEYKVEPRRPVDVSILATGNAAEWIDGNRELIESLATCRLKQVSDQLEPAENAARAQAGGCEVFVEGLVDPAAEKQRLAKQCDDLKRQINGLRGRLANESYIAKAPPELVRQTRDQLAAAEGELHKLGCE